MSRKFYDRLGELYGIQIVAHTIAVERRLRPATLFIVRDPAELPRMTGLMKVVRLRLEKYPKGGAGYILFPDTPESLRSYRELEESVGDVGAFDRLTGQMLGYLTPAALSNLQYPGRWEAAIQIMHHGGIFRMAPQIVQGEHTEREIRDRLEPLRSGLAAGLLEMGQDASVTTWVRLTAPM